MLSAFPARTYHAVFLERISTDLEPSLDALEQLLGAREAESFFEGAPLPFLALDALSGAPGRHGLDLSGGLAVFRTEGFEGAIGVVAVESPAAASLAVRSLMERAGWRFSRGPGGWRARVPSGEALAVFVEDGHLYLAMPDERSTADVLEQARRSVIDAGTLAHAGLVQELQATVAPGDVFLFYRPRHAGPIRGALLSLEASLDTVRLDGYASLSGAPPAAPRPSGELLGSAPRSPVLAARLSIDPRLAAALARATAPGLDAEAALRAFGGELSVAYYFDPALLVSWALSDPEGPEPLGTLLLEATLADSAAARALLEAWLDASEVRYSRVLAHEAASYRFSLRGEPVEAEIDGSRLRARAGPSLNERPAADLLASAALPGAFGEGHLTAVLDLRPVREGLSAPTCIEGAEPEDVAAMQWLLRELLLQGTQVDRALLEVGPEGRGFRIRGTFTLRGLDAAALARPDE